MRYGLTHILMVMALMLCSLHCAAAEPAPRDTVYFYDTWEQMLDKRPVSMMVNPGVVVVSPYSIVFSAYNKLADQIDHQHIAASMGDSIWLVNSNYLERIFETQIDYPMGYIPVFFNDKVAYVIYHSDLSLKDVVEGLPKKKLYKVDYFYIDFLKHRVNRVTPDYLSQLLESYHDLQMRYESMKDYKKQEIIEEYFLKYVDRVSEDIMRPYIVDLTY